MLDLSKRARLGLYVLVELAREPDTQRASDELAVLLQVSGNHLAKVMQTLARVGWVNGTRGAHGGYRLVADPKGLSMADVVEAFEGKRPLDVCGVADHGACVRKGPCTLKAVFSEIEDQAYYTLQSVTIAMLARPAPSQVKLSTLQR